MKQCLRKGFRISCDRLTYGGNALFEYSHRERNPGDETRYTGTSLRISAKALPRHVRGRLTIENSWHRRRNTQLKEDAHRCRKTYGVQILITLRSLAMNALRLNCYWYITEGLARTGSGTEFCLTFDEP